MTNLDKLHAEHADLEAIVARLWLLLGAEGCPNWVELHALRERLVITLTAHLKVEDWVLYPRLIDGSDLAVAAIARAFCDEMGGLAAAFIVYVERWDSPAIEADWPGYRAATAPILKALITRIEREERELYPLVTQVAV
ncbi:MAG: hemerythrin domain-containing protein [Novosphingobium sp.]